MVSQGLIDDLKRVTCSMLSKWNWRKLVVSAKKEIERASLPASKVSHTGAMQRAIHHQSKSKHPKGQSGLSCQKCTREDAAEGYVFPSDFYVLGEMLSKLIIIFSLFDKIRKLYVMLPSITNVFQGNYDGWGHED